MNRTSEYEGLLKLLGDIQIASAEDDEDQSREASLPPSATDFDAAAQSIAAGFNTTLRLVQRLQKLVTRKGLHNDPTTEIEDVTAVYRKDLAKLQRDIEGLLKYAEVNMSRNSQRRRHGAGVVESLKARAAEHTKLFQEALQVRQTVLKDQAERRKLFTHGGRTAQINYDPPLFAPPPASAPSTQMPLAMASSQASPSLPQIQRTNPPPGPPHSTSLPHQPHANGRATPPPALPFPHPNFSSGPETSMGLATGPGPPAQSWPPSAAGPYPYRSSCPIPPTAASAGLRPGGEARLRRRYGGPGEPAEVGRGGRGGYEMQQQAQNQNTGQRLTDARAIERTIAELGQTFSKMAGLVAAQSEVVIRIDDDMEMALEDVRKGHSEMESYLRIVKGNRSVIVKVFLIMIGFIIVFVRYF